MADNTNPLAQGEQLLGGFSSGGFMTPAPVEQQKPKSILEPFIIVPTFKEKSRLENVLEEMPKTEETRKILSDRSYNTKTPTKENSQITWAFTSDMDEVYNEKQENMDKEDKDRLNKFQSFKSNMEESGSEMSNLETQINNKLYTVVDGKSYQQELDELALVQSNYSPEEYTKKLIDVYTRAGALKEAIELNKIQSNARLSTLSIASNIPEEELRSIQEKGENVDEYVAKKIGTSVGNLNAVLDDKFSQLNNEFITKYNIDLNAKKANDYFVKDSNIKGLTKIFNNMGVIVDEEDMKDVYNKAVPSYIEKTIEDDVTKNRYISYMTKGNLAMLSELKGNLKAGDDSEKGEFVYDKYLKVLDSSPYKLYAATVADLMKDERFYEEGTFLGERFVKVLNETPEYKLLKKTLLSIESQIEYKQGEEKEYKLPGRPLDKIKLGFDIASSVAGINSTKDVGGISGESFALGEEGRGKFIDYLIKDIKLEEDTQKKKSTTFVGGLLNTSAKIIGAILDNPVDTFLTSDTNRAITKTALYSDPSYSLNRYNSYAEMISDLGNAFFGKPSDLLVAAGAFSAARGLDTVVSSLAKTTGGSKAIEAIASMTTNNYKNAGVRKASQYMQRGLSSMFETTNNGLNFYFWNKSNSIGVDPMWDFGIDFALGVRGRVAGALKGTYKSVDEVYSIFSATEKSLGKGESLTSSVRKNLENHFSARVLEGVTEDMLKSPTKTATQIQMNFLDIAKDPNLMKQTLSDGLRKVLDEDQNTFESFKNAHLKTFEAKYPELRKTISDDKEFMLKALDNEGALEIANLSKFKLMNYEYNLTKDSNPILKNLDELVGKYKTIADSIEDATLKQDYLNALSQFRGNTMATVYGMFNNTKQWSVDKFDVIKNNFTETISKLVGPEDINKQLQKAVKETNFGQAIDDFNKLYKDATQVNIKEGQKARKNLSENEKKSFVDSTLSFLNDAEKSEADSFLKDLGFKDEEIEKIGTQYNKNISAIQDKLSGKFSSGLYTVQVSDYSDKIQNIFNNANSILNKNQQDKFNLLMNTIKGIAKGDVKMFAMGGDMREIYRKISPYMNMNSIEGRSMIMNDFANMAIIDTAVSKLGKQGATETLQEAIKNISEGFGNRIFGSLRKDVRDNLIKSLDSIEDLEKFLKKEGLENITNKEEILSKLFEKAMKGFVYGQPGAITNAGKKFLGESLDFVEGSKLNEKITKIFNMFLDSNEAVSKYLNGTNGEKGINIAANVVGENITQEVIEESRKTLEKRGKLNIVQSGLNIGGAASLSSKEDVLKLITEGKTAEEISRYITSAYYDDVNLEALIAYSLDDKEILIYRQAVEIAKNRRALAAELLPQFYDGEKRLESIDYNGQTIQLRNVLNNLDYKLTSNNLITTANHDLAKFAAIDDYLFFLQSTKDSASQYINAFPGIRNGIEKFVEKFSKIVGGDTDAAQIYTNIVDGVFRRLEQITGEKELAGDLISRMLVGMPQYIDDLTNGMFKRIVDDNGKITNLDYVRSSQEDLYNAISKNLLEKNLNDAVIGYQEVYNKALDNLKAVEQLELGLEKTSLRLKYLGNNVKNYQLAIMDGILNNTFGKAFKISEKNFKKYILKSTIGDSKTMAGNIITGLIDEFNMSPLLKKLGYGFGHTTTRSDLVMDLLHVLDTIDHKNLKKILKENYEDYTKNIELFRKEVESLKDNVPEKYIKQEVDRLKRIAESNIPIDKTLESFIGDVTNSKLVIEDMQKNIEQAVIGSIPTPDLKTTTLVSEQTRAITMLDSDTLSKGIKKLGDKDTQDLASQLLTDLDNLQFIARTSDLEGLSQAQKAMYESGLGKQLFEFKGDGFKQIVVDPKKGYRIGGEVRIYQDIEVGKRATAFKKFGEVFGSVQSFLAGNKEAQETFFKGLNIKGKYINTTKNINLSNMVDKLFEGKPRQFISTIHLQTFLNEWKKGFGKILKDNRRLTKSGIKDDFQYVIENRRKRNWIQGAMDKGKKSQDYYEYIDAYFEAINEGRKSQGVSTINKDNFDFFFGAGYKDGKGGDVLQGVFGYRGAEGQDTLNALEGLDGLRLGLDEQDIGRLTDLINPFMGKDAVSRYLFNTFAKSETVVNRQRKILRGLKQAETTSSAFMYAMMFNPLASPRLGTQQILQNMIHSQGRGMKELGLVNDEYFDEVMQLFSDNRDFELIAGEMSQNLLQDPVAIGKNVLYNFDKQMMKTSVQNIADRATQSLAKQTSLSAAFIEYGHSKESTEQLFRNIGDINKQLDAGLSQYISFKQLVYKDDKRIKNVLSKNLITEGKTAEEAQEIISQVMQAKTKLGSLGKIMDSYYIKLGTFYQFATIPQISNSRASSRSSSRAFMKFLNRGTKKAGEYSIEFAQAIASGNRGKYLDIITKLTTEALYVGKAYSYMNRMFNSNGDTQIDPVSFYLTLYTPFIVVNMLASNLLTGLAKKAYNDDKIVDINKESIMDLAGGLFQDIADRSGVGVAYWVNMLWSASKTNGEKKSIYNKVLDDAEYIGNTASILGESFWNKHIDRAIAGTEIKSGGETYKVSYNSNDNAVNSLLGNVTADAMLARRYVDEINSGLYDGKEVSSLGMKIFMGSVDYRGVAAERYERMKDVGVYDVLNGQKLSTRLWNMDSNIIDKKSETLRQTLNSMSAGSAAELEAKKTSTVQGTYPSFTIVKKMLAGLKPEDDLLQREAEQKKLDTQKLKEAILSVIDKSNGKKSLQDLTLSAEIDKYKGNMGEAIVYGNVLQSQLDRYEKQQKEIITKEKYGVKWKDLKVESQKTEVNIEVGKRGQVYANQLVIDNYETIGELNRGIPVELAKLYTRTMLGDEFVEKTYSLSEELKMYDTILQQQGLGYLGNSNNIFSFMGSKLLQKNGITSTDNEEQKKKKIEKQKGVIQSMNNMTKENEMTAGVKIGMMVSIYDNFNLLDEETRKSIAPIIEESAELMSVSEPLTDQETMQQIFLEQGLYDNGGGSSGRAISFKLGKTVDKLNKFQEIKEEAMRFQNKSIETSVRYKEFNGSIVSIQVPKSQIKQDVEWKYFPAPKTTKPKTEEIKQDTGKMKTITAKKYTPKTIKKIQSKFK